VPGAECLLLSNAGIFLRTAKSLTNSYGVAIIEDVHPGYYQVNESAKDRSQIALPLERYSIDGLVGMCHPYQFSKS